MLQVELKVASGRQQGKLIPLPPGKFLVGREEDCHLRPNSEMVSRHHCVFTVDDFACRLRDLGSTNGTFVNGERIRTAVVLKAGDRVAIGKLDFEVVLTESAELETKMNLAIDSGTQIGIPQTSKSPEAASVQTVVLEEAAAAPSSSDTMMEIPAATAAFVPPSGDTAYALPQGMPQQQGIGYPPGYPPQFMPYGYPQMPMGYPQMPMGYPQMPMGYPQMPMGYPQMPMQGVPASEPAAPAAGPAEVSVRLPDPAETGAKEPEPKPEGGSGGNKAELKIKDVAGDVIKQYLNRRPTGN